MLLQLQACADNLVVYSGVLGLLRTAGSRSQRPRGTRRALLRSGDAAGTAGEPLVEHILGHVVFYVSDGDSAPHLAGHMLRRGSERASGLRVVIRDRAHSSRRLYEHAFAADPVLHSLLHTAVLKPRIIVRQIKDSQPLRQIFVAEARGQTQRGDLIAAVTDMPFCSAAV